ncbi:hypothetical protein N7509_008234 [Penicillium cosmopolitanum]|uniref:Alpha/beta hydrolase fold-3 domain-containing protein n=1 Tax=Penicillium cosmopolitanum TaxID=1131564 RepID=A0A9W9VM79_9EURO|nr:uncharacterized protein N7509_008234 [Penicillium cosmopolitanum]KAJ5385693.1 hypothetical protein N7509_008234 [Penicillium cosmopolitanum]
MASFSEYGGVAPEWAALIATQPESDFSQDLSARELRCLTNNQREEAARRYIQTIVQDDVSFQDFSCEVSDGSRIPLRVYKPKSGPVGESLPLYVWYHGGGFLFGSLASEDAFCFSIVRALKTIVVNNRSGRCRRMMHTQDSSGFSIISIRLGGDSQRIILAGASAGALLAVGVTLRSREGVSYQNSGRQIITDIFVNQQQQPRIRALILDIPVLCHTANFPHELISAGRSSYYENKDAPILPASRMKLFEDLLGKNALEDPEYNLLLKVDDDLKGLPPTHFHIAGRDILRDQAFLFMQKLDRNRIPTSMNVYPGLPHGFRRYRDLKATQQWFKDHVAAAEKLLEAV